MNTPIDFDPYKTNTHNTYDKNYKAIPNTPGVYFIVSWKFDNDNKKSIYDILYIGSAKNLKQRYTRHEVMRALKYHYDFLKFYFIEIDNQLEHEKKLIKKYQPKYNTQWR